MAYQIKCDEYIIHDIRDEELILYNPKVNVETNKVGDCSFTIYDNHPYYDKLKILRSVFEVSDEVGIIFRGRMTENTRDFNNGKVVDLEGAMAFFNDSLVPPYSFPEDFKNDDGYIKASQNGNVVEFYLNWLIGQHNSQVDEFQRFKLGNVTVSDPNNYISRSSENDVKTWNELKSKLFDSSLGGYLCIRYEADGNYIDYLSDFEYMNEQEITLGENLLDLLDETDGSLTCTAIKPLGAELDDEQGETFGKSKKLTIESLPDRDITDDIVKKGSILYSKSAREKYGMIFADVDKTTWSDVKIASNLLTKGAEWLSSVGVMLSGTIEINAVDLHFSDEEIRSFRIYRKVRVTTERHGISKMYNLTKLGIDLLQPQNTKITVGETRKTLTQTVQTVENVKSNYEINQEKIYQKIENISKTLRMELTSNYGIYQKLLQDNSFAPDYTVKALTITPKVFFKEAETTENLTFIWKRKTGESEEPLNASETVENGTLKVAGNMEEDTVSYICYATYTVSETERYVARASMDFALVKDGEKGDTGAQGLRGLQGPKGDQGIQGPKGDTGAPGAAGTDGRTSYFHIKYSSVANPTSASQMTETPSTYIGTYVDFTQADSNDPSKYTWSRFEGSQGAKGDQGIPGTNGSNGKTSYLHIAYANSADGSSGFSVSDSTGKLYIGQYTDFVEADSTDRTKYSWTKIKGETGATGAQGPKGDTGLQGPQGVQGPKGADGKQYYTWLKYADTPTSGMSDSPTGKAYIGLAYNKTTATESSNYSDYTWSLIKGEKGDQGLQGPKGADGKQYYTWIKYANDSSGSGLSDNPTGKTYIGIAYNKTTATESTVASDYTWSLIKGDKGDKGATGPQGPTGATGAKGDKGDTGAAGADGERGSGILKITTAPSAYTTVTGGVTPAYRIARSTVVTQSGAANILVGDILEYSYYHYPVILVNSSYVYTGARTSIRGATGAAGKDAAIISSTEPTDKTYLWCDTSSTPPLLKQWNGEEWIVVNDNAEQITQIYKELSTSINQMSESILLQVGEKTYTKEETDRLVSDVNTSFEQTKNSFNYEFNNFRKNLDDLANSTNARFENTSKYIRFIDGEIFIGVEGNPIMLRQKNDRISFFENNAEVAYISNRMIYFTHAEILKDLKIGQFGFVVMEESGYAPYKLIT